MKDILTEVPDDALVETIIHEYKDRKTSAADLKKIISKFVPDNQEKKEILLTKVNEALKNVNASEQEIKFLTTEENWQSLALSQKIDEFLTLSPERYSNISQQFGLKQFIEMAITSDNLKSSSVIEKFFIFFTDKDSAVRKVAGKDIFELVDVVFSGRKAEFFEVLFSGLISAFRTESEKEILDIVIAALEKLIFISLSAEDYKLFKNVFIEFNNLLVLEGLTKEKKEKIRELIKQLTSENILKRVIEKLLDFVDNNKDYSQISELLVVIGKPAVGYLIEEAMLEKNIGFVGYFAGYLRRKAVARILVQTEKEFVKDELKKKLMDNRWFIVRNTMDLIMHTEEPQLYPLFDLVKKHNDVRIRRKLTFILGRLNCKDSLNLCYELSADPDENVSLSALRIIGQLGDKASIEALSKIKLKGLPEEAKVAAIEDIKKRIGS